MGNSNPDVKTTSPPAADVVVPLLDEELEVTKRDVVTDRVRVRTVTETADELVREELQSERVEVTRLPVNHLLEPGAPIPQVRTEDDVTIIPVFEEVLVVEKRLLVKEELRLVRRSTNDVFELPITLRKQTAVVEHEGPNGALSSQIPDQTPEKDASR